MSEIRTSPEGALWKIHALPGGKRRGWVLARDGGLKVIVTEPAEDGRANQALLETIAETLGLRRSHVELVSGKTARQKTILVRNMPAADLNVLVESLKNSLR